MTDTSTASVTGPVVGGAHGWPFGGATTDLAAHGFVQEEYFLEGEATRYTDPAGAEQPRDGRWRAEPAERAPYRTRFVVTRPVDPTAFNGTVILYWNNVSAGFDGFSGNASAEILEGGYAYVAASAQIVGVHGAPPDPQGLTVWDPERYASLLHPGDDYSYDIFTQVARVVGSTRPRQPLDPMGGLDVRHIVAEGGSQSAMRLATYVNAIQPLASAIDGFVISLYFGVGSPLESDNRLFTAGSDSSGAFAFLQGSHLIRDDLVPVMVLNSESEAPFYLPVRQPDSDRFRYWEVSGAAHMSRQIFAGTASSSLREFGLPAQGTAGMNEVPMTPVTEAATRHLHHWLRGGPAPAVLPRIEFAGDPPKIVRDEHGIARGGVRLPQVEVPIAMNGSIDEGEDVTSRMAGICVPFPREKIEALYGDVATYLARFETAARSAEDAGVLLPRDVEALVVEAREQFPSS